ncbi:MAG: NTP transferase domain-containing protein [Armatimonadetes bacterium]|nr:NTP transferase domain-containing protein [Armatimonadota bacterium]
MDIVILAGGRCDDELRKASGADTRAEIEIDGTRLVDTVLSATSPLGEPILVGGPSGITARQVEAGANFCDSLSNGLSQVKTEHFLLVTVDLPCLTTESLNDFVDRCDRSAGLNYPIVPMQDCEARFPGMRRTTLKLREGEFTGGNVALMEKEMMARALPVMERAYEVRKKPLLLAQTIGLGVLGRVMLGQVWPRTLRLAALERAVGKFLGVPVRGVISRYAELGADLDKAEQYEQFARLQKT